MYNPFKFFNKIKIRSKLMLSYIIIILFTVLMIGIFNYEVSVSIVKDNTIKYSGYLMEQLSGNLSSKLMDIEDLQFSFYRYSDLGNYIKSRQDESDLDYSTKMRGIGQSLLDLTFSKQYIKAVVLIDKFGEKYYSGAEKGYSVDHKAIENKIDINKIKDLSGKVIWTSVGDNLLIMERGLIDLNSTDYIGAISLAIESSYVTDFYKNVDKTRGGKIILLDGNNNICMKVDQLQKEIVNVLSKDGTLDDNLNAKTIRFMGEEYIVSISKLSNTGLKLMNVISVKDLTRSSKAIEIWIVITCITSFIIALLIATFISKGITNNIRLLVRRIKEFSEGRFDVKIKPMSQDEIGVLTEEFNKMTDKINNLINEVYNTEILKKNAEFKALQFEYSALQSKINPHFLYNTLESINSMAKIKGEKEISEMVFLLGNLLRESISGKGNKIHLEKELEYIKNYLRIQKITYGSKFDVKYDMDENLAMAMVPKFILQPIVENAIVHGIEEKIGKGIIEINCYEKGGNLCFEVFDDGIGIREEYLEKLLDYSLEEEEAAGRHTKVGIRSVDKRIKILYGEEFGLKIFSEPGEGTRIVISIPLVMEGNTSSKAGGAG